MSLPPNFYHPSFPGMVPLNPQYPMGGLMPMVPGVPLLHPGVGITVPTGVASVTAAPVRNLTIDPPSILGPYPGAPLLPTPSPLLETPNIIKKTSGGPSITVFVGSITDRASDMLIRQILSKCGVVNNWKRVQGANGKLQAFGFCDFGDPESAMRAIRILHDFEISDKKLVVKTDAKAKEKLDDYFRGKKSLDDPVNEETKREDDQIKAEIIALLREHEIELARDPDASRERARRAGKTADPKGDNLDDVEMEEEKRHLINREIDKFRDTYKEDPEPEKVNEKPNDERRRDERLPESDRIRDRNRKQDSGRSRRDRSPAMDDRGKILEDEETIERRQQERQLREKEMSYQRRLQKWEDRELRKAREIESRKRRDAERKTEESKEAIRLKVFLEDYDDDRDDVKYYRGKTFLARMKDRQKEIEEDERDRRAEKRELEDLRRKLIEEGHPDPEDAVKSHQQKGEEARSLIDRLVSAARDGNKGEESLSGLSSTETPMDDTAATSVISFPGMRLKAETASPTVKEVKRQPDIFNSQEEDDATVKKRRKLPTLDDDDSMGSNNYGKTNESRFMSTEEKRKQIKELIEEIPTSKEELFKYPIDWTMVDNALMEKRVRPWINKKIAEYIGEEEPALLEFICSKLSSQSTAESILNEVVMVLDEEAEVFVVKMWRLLIYEISAKKAGLAK